MGLATEPETNPRVLCGEQPAEFAGTESRDLWAVLLGSGTFAGAFETAYMAAPPQVLASSMT